MGIYIFIYILSIKLSISFIPKFIHIANNFCLFFVEIFVMFLLQNVDAIHRNYKKWCKFCRKTKNHRHAQKASPLGIKNHTPPQNPAMTRDFGFQYVIISIITYIYHLLYYHILYIILIIYNTGSCINVMQLAIINIYTIIIYVYIICCYFFISKFFDLKLVINFIYIKK